MKERQYFFQKNIDFWAHFPNNWHIFLPNADAEAIVASAVTAVVVEDTDGPDVMLWLFW